MSEKILLLQPETSSTLRDTLASQFEVLPVAAVAEVAENIAGSRLLILDLSPFDVIDVDLCTDLLLRDGIEEDFPIVLIAKQTQLSDKLAMFELGFDDVMSLSMESEAICARLHRLIFHAIASAQLKSRLQLANETAYSVMSDNSDLGNNIQFLLGSNHWDNLDQLGQLFFRAIQHYNVTCSLQMRSAFGVKNMDANGMTRDLESVLLTEMKGAGRYVDFGKRSITNYNRVSLLIRNMPVDDERRYGAIKDNTFALVQGLDARIKALDANQRMENEAEALRKLSQDINQVIVKVEQTYQSVMRSIVNVVEDMGEQIQGRIPQLALSEVQESFFESVSENCIAQTNRIFNDGLKVDEVFKRISEDMNKALENLDQEHEDEEEGGPDFDESTGDGIELF